MDVESQTRIDEEGDSGSTSTTATHSRTFVRGEGRGRLREQRNRGRPRKKQQQTNPDGNLECQSDSTKVRLLVKRNICQNMEKIQKLVS